MKICLQTGQEGRPLAIASLQHFSIGCHVTLLMFDYLGKFLGFADKDDERHRLDSGSSSKREQGSLVKLYCFDVGAYIFQHTAFGTAGHCDNFGYHGYS